MPAASKVASKKLLAKKRKLQREFLEKTKAEGLTAAEVTERASIFPKNAKLRVVKWPRF